MVGVVEKRYSDLRHRLDSLGYSEAFPLDSLGLVDHLLTDLVRKDEALTRITQKYKRASEVLSEFRDGVSPFKTQILTLTDENSRLRLHVLKTEENAQKLLQANKRRLLELENENLDLKLLVNQFMVRLQDLEVESLQKTKELGRVHQESLEGVILISSDGDKLERKSKVRKQRMELNCASLVPLCPHCVRLRNLVEFGPDRTKDPKVLDYLKIADSRIECLQLLVRKCKEDKEELKETIKELQQRLYPGGDGQREAHQSQSGRSIGHGHDSSGADRNVSMALKTAKLQLNILQRRNIELEDQLKKSILNDNGRYLDGRKMSKEIENGLLEGLIKAHGGGYPSLDQMTLEEKNKFLEAQLSHCCEEKAKLKFLLEACQEGRRGDGTSNLRKGHPNSPGQEPGENGASEYSRFRRVSSRSGGGGAPRFIRSTTTTSSTNNSRKEQRASETSGNHLRHAHSQTRIVEEEEDEEVEIEEWRNGETEGEPMTSNGLPLIQEGESSRSIIMEEFENRENRDRRMEDSSMDSHPQTSTGQQSNAESHSQPSARHQRNLESQHSTQLEFHPVPPKPITQMPITVTKDGTDRRPLDKKGKGGSVMSSSVSIPKLSEPKELQQKGSKRLKVPASSSSSNIQGKVPAQLPPKTQQTTLTFGNQSKTTGQPKSRTQNAALTFANQRNAPAQSVSRTHHPTLTFENQQKAQAQLDPKTQNAAMSFGKSDVGTSEEKRGGGGRNLIEETQNERETGSVSGLDREAIAVGRRALQNQNGTTTTTNTSGRQQGLTPLADDVRDGSRMESGPTTSSRIQDEAPSSRSPQVSDGFSVSSGSYSDGGSEVMGGGQEEEGTVGRSTTLARQAGIEDPVERVRQESTSGKSIEIITIKSPPGLRFQQGQDPRSAGKESKGEKDQEIGRLQNEITRREEEVGRLERALAVSQTQTSEREGVVDDMKKVVQNLRKQLGDLGSDLIQAQRERNQMERRVNELEGGEEYEEESGDLLHENKGLRAELKRAKDELLFYDQVLQDKDEELKEMKNRLHPASTSNAGSGKRSIHQSQPTSSAVEDDWRRKVPSPKGSRKSQEVGAEERGSVVTSESLTLRIPTTTAKANSSSVGNLSGIRPEPSRPLTPTQEMLTSSRERVLEREILSLRSSVAVLDREKGTLVDELGEKENRLRQLESKYLQQAAQVTDLEQKLTLSQMEIRRNVEIHDSKERDLALLRRQLENARRDFEGIGRDRDDLLKKLREVSSVQSITQLDRRTLQTELEKRNGEVEELRGKIQRYIEEVRRIEELLESKEEENGVLLAQYRNLRDEFSELENAQVSLEKESDTARVSTRLRDQENSSLRNQLHKQSSLISSYEDQIGKLSQDVAGLETKLNSVTQSGQNAESNTLTLHSSYLSLEKKLDSLRLELANCLSNRKKLEGETDDLRNRNAELERLLGLESENMSRLEEIVDTYKEAKALQDEKIFKLISENGQLEEQILKLMDRNDKLHEELGHYRLKCAEGTAELDRIRRLFENEKLERETALEELKNLRHHLTTSSASLMMNSALYSRGSVSPVTSQMGTGRSRVTSDEPSGRNTPQPTPRLEEPK